MKAKGPQLHQLLQPQIKLERAVEMLLHAYDYVREVDPADETGAADLVWSKYEELKRKQRQRS